LKICFLGAGALGCALGGVLTEAGNEVWLINRNADQVNAMNSRGLIGCGAGEVVSHAASHAGRHLAHRP
jgi:ketopantoate reductase